MKRRTKVSKAGIALTAAAGFGVLGTGIAAAAPGAKHADPAGDGTGVTSVGFRVTPAGIQAKLGDLPLNVALSPDGNTLLVSNDGQATQSLQAVDARTSEVKQTIPYTVPEGLFYGVAFSPDGKHAYASAGGNEKIRVYDVADGRLTETTPIQLPKTNPSGGKVNLFPAGLALTPDGRRLVVADHLADAVSVVDLATDNISTTAIGHAPYAVSVSPDGSTAYVGNEGANTVSVVGLTGSAPVVRRTIQVGTHPNAQVVDPAHHRLYVANGDSDEISVIDTGTERVASTISVSPYRGAQVGSNPDGLALSPGGRRLYVANSGNNDVDVMDTAKGQILGSIPTGWYPTGVAASAGNLYVASAKGLGAGPNNGPGHPDPTSTAFAAADQYTGSMMVGTLSTVSLPLSAETLARDTRQVAVNDGFTGNRRAGAIVPLHPGGPTPIKHVIYVVQENRTFDQVFGSLGKGNGDPSLNLFGQESAPNQRALEREFATFDNFYADAEVSAQGWNWTVAANSNPYSEQLWPANYSPRNAPYPSETNDPATAPGRTPADAYIWDRLADKKISFRNYGFYVNTDSSGHSVATDPVLQKNTDPDYRGFDLKCPDNPDTFQPLAANCGTPRYTAWLNEFQQYEKNGNLPSVEFVRLGNDHTSGTSVGKPTPRAYVADNDLALGRLVDAVSHSKDWDSTAIFVTEDDSQNGPDHVDAHRTLAEVISPYTQTGRVDSTFYSTASMVRTIEQLVGVTPLTQFDAYATPMTPAFAPRPNRASYAAITPSQPFDAVNTAQSPMAKQSAAQDLRKEDQINEQEFNQAIWKSVKGAGSTMPAPRYALGQTPQAADSDG